MNAIYKLSKRLLILTAIVCLVCFPGTVQAVKKTDTDAVTAEKATVERITAEKRVSEGEWVRTAAGRKYRYKNGVYAKDTWLRVRGSVYHFDSQEICQTGWFTVDGKKYYGDKNTGKVAVNRVIRSDGKYYYVDKAGVMVTGSWVKTGGRRCYFGKKGIRAKSVWIKYKKNHYYVGSDGAMAVNSWVGDYYVGSDGTRQKNCTVDGYRLGADGRRVIKTFNGKYIFLGDSRMVGMQISKAPADTMYIAKRGMGYEWLNSTAGPVLRKYLKSNPNVKVVLALGVNDLRNVQLYIKYYKYLIRKYPKTEFYILSVNPVDEAKEALNGYHVKNDRIVSFNKTLRSAFGPSVYINSYDYLKKNGPDTVDGLHYTEAVYKRLYDYIIGKIK